MEVYAQWWGEPGGRWLGSELKVAIKICSECPALLHAIDRSVDGDVPACITRSGDLSKSNPTKIFNMWIGKLLDSLNPPFFCLKFAF
jgi:pheromone shutdown protein TraB